MGKGERGRDKGKEKGKGERERDSERRRERRKEKAKGTGNRIFLCETMTVDCAIYRLPLRSICKGKGQGGEKGERRKEKGENKRERRKEKSKGNRIFPLGNHNCGLRHLQVTTALHLQREGERRRERRTEKGEK